MWFIPWILGYPVLSFTDANTVTEQVTVDLKELMEDQSSSDVEGNQCKFTLTSSIKLKVEIMSQLG